MKAAVLYQLKTPLRVEDVDLDPPRAREVRVRIAANGVCHSDYSVIRGVLRSPLPVVPGHEGAGVVEEVGPEVPLVRPGDRVVLSFAPYCGHCYYCAHGQLVLCDNMRVVTGKGTLLDGTCRIPRLIDLYLKGKLKLDERVSRPLHARRGERRDGGPGAG